MSQKLGKYIIATGILHNVVGVIFYWKPLMAMMQHGIFNSVEPHFDRTSAFWFLIAGGLMMMLGLITDWMLAKIDTLPRSLGIGMLVIGGIGVIFMPVSGFWLFLIEGSIALKYTKQGTLMARSA